MTWTRTLVEMVREEFVSAQRRGRGIIDRVGEELEPLPLVAPVVEISKKRNVKRRRIVHG